MADKWHSLPRLLRSREFGDGGAKFVRQSCGQSTFVNRLGLHGELNGHTGCVNCLQWNISGTLLASGSDDQTVKLWEPQRGRLLHSLNTGHTQNIFSVKFMPQTGDCLVASGAADRQVRLLDFSRQEVTRVWNCHRSRVKRLDISPDEPSLLWSCSEDGTVRQLDLREPHQCGDSCANAIVALGQRRSLCLREIKCLAINPIHPRLLAAGCGDGVVRVYDRRCMASSSADDLSADEDRHCLAQLFPGHLQSAQVNYKPMSEFVAVTYVAWSSCGRQLLANVARDQVYLYDIWNPQPVIPDLSYSVPASPVVARSEGDHHWDGEALSKKMNSLFARKHLSAAVAVCMDAVQKHPQLPAARSQLAHALQRRAWPGDTYAALREVRTAASLQPNSHAAALRVLHGYNALQWWAAAKDCAEDFERRFPQHAGQQEYRSLCSKIRAKYEADKKISDRPRGEARPSQDAREYQALLCRGIADGCKVESSSSSSAASHGEAEGSRFTDFASHYCGHCNTSTDIKEANFLDPDGRYIVAGSDDGVIFIWERDSTQLVRALRADSNIVNCLQPHPSQFLLASSGIDSAIRLWSPGANPHFIHPPNYSPVEASPEELGVLTTDAMENIAAVNQWRMFAVPFDFLISTLAYREVNADVL